ncbi:MAG: TrkH family potassium uptake protein [Acidimicrobiales bacterium]
MRRCPSLPAHITGLTLAVAGAGILVSALVEVLVGGPDTLALILTGTPVTTAGVALWWATRVPDRIHLLGVFSTVTVAWVALAVAGALPYLTTGSLPSFDDAVFESISGFTTTGATVLRPVESASLGLLFWRSITQWIGGMGVIVLVVAVLPTIGTGGFDLLEAEAPGPAGERLTPRVRHTAARLWGVYVGFTMVLALAYGVAGMNLYDAVSHSFTTVSTGGFSPYNRSLGHFESAAIEWIAIVAMFLAGGSFTLYYRALRGSVGPLLTSVEFRFYLTLVLAMGVIVHLTADPATSGHQSIRDAFFAVTSVMSTTGYGSADFAQWSHAAQAFLLLAMPVGAMAGSTAGGVKMVRVLAVASFAHRATLRQLHPKLVRPVRVGANVLDESVTNKVLGFLVLALATFGGASLLIALTGADIVTSLSVAATTFGNVGPGLGEAGPASDFLVLPRPARWVGALTMLLGRLEIYPILLALAALPQPWRRWRHYRQRLVDLTRAR